MWLKVDKPKEDKPKKKSKIHQGNDIPLDYQVFMAIYKIRKDNG
tara:strand:+ start:5950 stop:6081 length:132 start_codon:yes stop_codon:yes gene_type:complete